MSNDNNNGNGDPTHMAFSDLAIARLNISNRLKAIGKHTGRKTPRQALIWDSGQRGLSLAISYGGARTFRCQYKLRGEWKTATLGRFGEMVTDADPNHENLQVGEARRLAADYRAKASKGIDPLATLQAPPGQKLFAEVITEFIEHYAKPRQRTWAQTERILRVTCAPLLNRPIGDITKAEVRQLLRSFKTHPYKLAKAQAWLRKVFRWANEQDLIEFSIMEGVREEYERRSRNRVYSDEELRAIWKAANQLDAESNAYTKLLLLTASRKTALAALEWAHLDKEFTTWTTPHELTKSRKVAKPRTYKTPLPALAQRIIKTMPRKGDRVFPTLPVRRNAMGQVSFFDFNYKQRLIAAGAPADFYAHALRHTLATFLEDRNHSVWERALVLNHSESGVTAGYSHGHPIDLKRQLLEKWAAHIEGLVAPGKATLLR